MSCVEVRFELPPDVQEFDSVGAPLRLELAQTRVRVSELIAQTVLAQVSMRRAMAEPQRDHLDEDEIRRQRELGRIVLPRPQNLADELQQHVERAQQAFADRRYRMILDGRWLTALDEEVELVEDSALVFLRLTPLVGG